MNSHQNHQTSRLLLNPSVEEGAVGAKDHLRRILANMGGTFWMTADFLVGVVAVLVGLWISPFTKTAIGEVGHLNWYWHVLTYSGALVVVAHIFALHDPHFERNWKQLLVKLFFVVGIASALVVMASVFVFYDRVGRLILLYTAGVSGALMFLLRLGFWQLTAQHCQRICLVGDEGFCARTAEYLISFKRQIDIESVHFQVSEDHEPGMLRMSGFGKNWTLVEGLPQQEDWNFQHWVAERGYDEVVLQSHAMDGLSEELMGCLDRGIGVMNYAEFVERYYQSVPVSDIDTRWFFSTAMEGTHPYYRILKRLMDAGIGLAGLVLTAPLMLLVAIFIRLESPGPVFYSQVRVGLHNKPFRIYKLRTMRQDAEKDGAKWAAKKDSRVTRVGTILRKTRIDEIPQFYNILRGDMSFIGPRPERPEFTKELAAEIPFYEKRHMVKPGLTGWAQIKYRYGASVDDARVKLRYDLYYVKHASLELDLHIIFRTIGAVMQGAR